MIVLIHPVTALASIYTLSLPSRLYQQLQPNPRHLYKRVNIVIHSRLQQRRVCMPDVNPKISGFGGLINKHSLPLLGLPVGEDVQN